MNLLPHSFFDRNAAMVAEELLGMLLVRRDGETERIGRIVETEAYLGPHDRAAHSAKGRTRRTEVMWGPPGYAYVYLVYGMHWCLNVVTESEGRASAVLIRALEPVQNLPDRTSGPGLLCRAMDITGALNGADLCEATSSLSIAAPDHRDRLTIVRRPRVGVAYAGPYWSRRLLRFSVKGSGFVSKK